MRFFSLALLLSLPHFAFADATAIFAGIGLTGGQSTFNVSEPSAQTSKFSTLGYLAEGGVTMGDRWGFQGSAELGRFYSNNTIASQTYLEAATNTFYTAKGGMYIGGEVGFNFGLGFRFSDWNVKSISTENNTFNDIKYKGTDSLIYGGVNLDVSRRYRTTLEAQYINGKLKSNDSSIAPISYNEMLFSIRFFVLFN